ncbi:hypothetical protein [Desulfuromonas sp. CSMB_57]|uniref:Tse2 family ADP-ribosyltransferase toxin n=1 Tax=Desulfuromonas sp. CSMB_57 TaxID=2807629 RepID=UPI001CD1DB30|nr:hypothetical protein [Desulfuromonas sp. CSMB_57]
MQLVDLFLAPEDLFRLGNATSPRLTHVRRPKDIDTIEINGITAVVANGKGVSLATRDRLDKTPVAGWVWMIAKGTHLPIGLKLINDRPGHYSVCPQHNMTLDEFVDLLSKLTMKCQKVFRKQVI